jgi:hypothetical protein
MITDVGSRMNIEADVDSRMQIRFFEVSNSISTDSTLLSGEIDAAESIGDVGLSIGVWEPTSARVSMWLATSATWFPTSVDVFSTSPDVEFNSVIVATWCNCARRRKDATATVVCRSSSLVSKLRWNTWGKIRILHISDVVMRLCMAVRRRR